MLTAEASLKKRVCDPIWGSFKTLKSNNENVQIDYFHSTLKTCAPHPMAGGSSCSARLRNKHECRKAAENAFGNGGWPTKSQSSPLNILFDDTSATAESKWQRDCHSPRKLRSENWIYRKGMSVALHYTYIPCRSTTTMAKRNRSEWWRDFKLISGPMA